MKIVREKYLSEIPGPDDRQELQEFLSELYVFLVDQMHAGLKKVSQRGMNVGIPFTIIHCTISSTIQGFEYIS